MARLYSNENLPLPVVVALRQLGHDVLTSAEAGHANQALPDDEVLRFATEQDRAVVTLNRKHFISLHKRNPEHAGIVVCTVDADFGGQAARIHQTISDIDALAGRLLHVNRPGPHKPQLTDN